MKQTPMHSNYNPDILKMMPNNLKRVVEVGCSSGSLAKAYADVNPDCQYIGVEIEAEYAEVARQFCSEVVSGNIEHFEKEKFLKLFPSDCWVFGDVLEHLYDPWTLRASGRSLRQMRRSLPAFPMPSTGVFRPASTAGNSAIRIRGSWIARISVGLPGSP